ncbi:MAG: Lrp/AsnC family transcriptional regulator [Thermodesulfobacteriota bacterium]
MDATDIAIINTLKDGRISFKIIAEGLGLAEGTVRTRVKRLRQDGLLDITGLVDPEALPDHSVVMIGIRVTDMDLVKKGDEFSKLRGVISVAVVTGRFDLILTVMLEKDFGILEFYTEEASKVDKVQSVETFVVYKSFNMKVTLPHMQQSSNENRKGAK